MNLQVWDTAGQERFYSVSKLFFRDAEVCFVCFEMSMKEPSNEIRNWIDRVREEADIRKIILVGTKSDLMKPEEIKKFKEEQMPKLCQEFKTEVFFDKLIF